MSQVLSPFTIDHLYLRPPSPLQVLSSQQLNICTVSRSLQRKLNHQPRGVISCVSNRAHCSLHVLRACGSCSYGFERRPGQSTCRSKLSAAESAKRLVGESQSGLNEYHSKERVSGRPRLLFLVSLSFLHGSHHPSASSLFFKLLASEIYFEPPLLFLCHEISIP